MATSAFTISSTWTEAATGPASVLIPAFENFRWAITEGGAPAVEFSVCPIRERGSDLSMELAEGESLFVASSQTFDTTVTTGA